MGTMGSCNSQSLEINDNSEEQEVLFKRKSGVQYEHEQQHKELIKKDINDDAAESSSNHSEQTPQSAVSRSPLLDFDDISAPFPKSPSPKTPDDKVKAFPLPPPFRGYPKKNNTKSAKGHVPMPPPLPPMTAPMAPKLVVVQNKMKRKRKRKFKKKKITPIPAPFPWQAMKNKAPLPGTAPLPMALPIAPPLIRKKEKNNRKKPEPFPPIGAPPPLPPMGFAPAPLPGMAPAPMPAPLPPMAAPLPMGAPPPLPGMGLAPAPLPRMGAPVPPPIPFAFNGPPPFPPMVKAPLPGLPPLPMPLPIAPPLIKNKKKKILKQYALAPAPIQRNAPPPMPFGFNGPPPLPPMAFGAPPPAPPLHPGYPETANSETPKQSEDDNSFLLFEEKDDEKYVAPKSSDYAVNYNHVKTKVAELTEKITTTDDHSGLKLLDIFEKIEVTKDHLTMWVRWSGGSFPDKKTAVKSLKTVLEYAEKNPSSPRIKNQLRVITKLIIEKGIEKSDEYVHFLLLLASHGGVCNVMKDVAINNAYGMMTESLTDIIKLQTLEQQILNELRNYRHILVEKLHLQFKFGTNQHTVNGFYNVMAPLVGLVKYIDNHLGTPGGVNRNIYKRNVDKRFFATLYNKENIIKRVYTLIEEKKIGYQKIVDFFQEHCPENMDKMDFLQQAINIDDGKINEDYLCWLLAKLNIFGKKAKDWKDIVKCWDDIK